MTVTRLRDELHQLRPYRTRFVLHMASKQASKCTHWDDVSPSSLPTEPPTKLATQASRKTVTKTRGTKAPTGGRKPKRATTQHFSDEEDIEDFDAGEGDLLEGDDSGDAALVPFRLNSNVAQPHFLIHPTDL